MIVQDLIKMVEKTFEQDQRVKICHKFQAGKALQIQLQGGGVFNLCIVKAEAFVIKR